MADKCVPRYTSLAIAYQEETRLYLRITCTKYFSIEECELIKEVFKRNTNDSFISWPKHLDFEYFAICVNSLHPAVIYTFEKTKLIHVQPYQILNFLDIEVILHSDNTVENNTYCKDTNTYECFPYSSTHP